MLSNFENSRSKRIKAHKSLVQRTNVPVQTQNGYFIRYQYPVLTKEHIPLEWRFDFNPKTNPFFMERITYNATMNSGALYWEGKYLLFVRVEGADRKSFFAIAESENGIDNFQFRERPIVIPDIDPEETNVYDMRMTVHEDGWVYGLFCSEKLDPHAPEGDLSSAVASTGVIRTKDLISWERLPNIDSQKQQRNVVLHPEFVQQKYALYTRPQDDFIMAGTSEGIGWALVESMENARIEKEIILNKRAYHTIKELKNGEGPPPIKTERGWLHLAHGVRNTAAGLRYVLYLYVTSLKDPTKIIAEPAGYFMAPEEGERVGDVSNVLFSNGWTLNERDEVYIYYASSDTRMHVAVSTLERLLDYCFNTAEDGLRSSTSVQNILALIERNEVFEKENKK